MSESINSVGSDRALASSSVSGSKQRERPVDGSSRIASDDSIVIEETERRLSVMREVLKESSEIRPDVVEAALAKLKDCPTWPAGAVVDGYYKHEIEKLAKRMLSEDSF